MIFVPKMRMHVDESGHQVLAASIDPNGHGRDRLRIHGTHRSNSPVLNYDGLPLKNSFAVHRHDIHVHKRDCPILRFYAPQCGQTDCEVRGEESNYQPVHRQLSLAVGHEIVVMS